MLTLSALILLIVVGSIVAFGKLRCGLGLRDSLSPSTEQRNLEAMTRCSPDTSDSYTSRSRSRTLIIGVMTLVAAAVLPLGASATTGMTQPGGRARARPSCRVDLSGDHFWIVGRRNVSCTQAQKLAGEFIPARTESRGECGSSMLPACQVANFGCAYLEAGNAQQTGVSFVCVGEPAWTGPGGPRWPVSPKTGRRSFGVAAAATTRSRVASAAAVCRRTELSNSDLSALSDAWRSMRKLSPHLRLVVDRFGKLPLAGQCGSTSWAYAYFLPLSGQHLSLHDQVQEQDGPDIFRRLAGSRWRDVGDTGGATPCDDASYDQGLPEALVKNWGLRCT